MTMFTISSCIVLLLALWVFPSDGCHRWTREPSTPDTDLPPKPWLCGQCGANITVTLKAIDGMKVTSGSPAPAFATITAPQRELVYFLEGAGYTTRFNYTLQFFPPWGYMVTTINSLSGSTADKTYWQILDQATGQPLKKGVSSYVPDDGQTILFNFTTWAN